MSELNELSNELHFEIYEGDPNINLDSDRFQKLEQTPEQSYIMDSLMAQMPMLMAADTLADSYKVVFPEGVTGSLMKLKQGGESSIIMGNEGISGHASLYKMAPEAALLGAFSVMSIATSQYFLTEIHSELKLINQKIDQIMDFLYGDKRAELLAEISFVQSAQQNYSSIMSHDTQRIATITGLQEARKTAMKDIEFYMSDLDSKSASNTKSFSDFKKLANDAFKVKESLELSMQLYIASGIMEAYFAQNFDPSFINSISESATQYINKCEKRILSDFSRMNAKLDSFKKVEDKVIKERCDTLIGLLSNGTESQLIRNMNVALDMTSRSREYYLNRNGEIYIRTA